MSDTFYIQEKDSKAFYSEATGQALSKQMIGCAQKFANQSVKDTLPLEEKFWDNLRGTKPHMLEGAKDFLQQIKDKGIRIIVWSGTRTDVLRTNIELLGLSSLVDFAIGNEPGSKTMVKGSGLLQIISRELNLSSEDITQRSLVIGDGIGDIEAGRSIGAITAGFTRIKKSSLESSSPDFFFSNYSEVLDRLNIGKRV